MLTGACSRVEQNKPSPKINLRLANLEIRRAVEQVGGSEVWIKKMPEADSAAGLSAGGASAEVLATPEYFEKVLAAIRNQASRQGLEAEVQPRRSGNRERVFEIRLTHQKRLAARWRLREVAQIRRVAIVIDDLGEDLEAARKLLELPYPLTFSVLPDLPYSARTAEEAHRRGRQVMLHLPMQPQPGAPAPPGPGEIRVGMTNQEVARIVAADLGSVPHARGVNNHMGSRATADPVLMAAVMQVLAGRRLFFVDSRTTTETAALKAARRMGVPSFFRSVFLDDTETVPYSLGQMRQLRRVAEQQGVALAIGHPHPSTIAALAQFLPELERNDIQLVPASELVRLPEVARLSPPSTHKTP